MVKYSYTLDANVNMFSWEIANVLSFLYLAHIKCVVFVHSDHKASFEFLLFRKAMYFLAARLFP